MKIELLNVRIEIQKSTVVTDKYGNHKNEWTPFYSCYATVSAESPKEDTAAGTVVDSSKIDFTVQLAAYFPVRLGAPDLISFRTVFPAFRTAAFMSVVARSA